MKTSTTPREFRLDNRFDFAETAASGYMVSAGHTHCTACGGGGLIGDEVCATCGGRGEWVVTA